MRLLDWAFILSGVGIWPRYIEPRLLYTRHHTVAIEGLKAPLRILHLSDLHMRASMPCSFMKKLSRKCLAAKPDLILITGDFISCGKMEDPLRLKTFLKGLKAPLGVFAVLGNHDFAEYLSKDHRAICDWNEKRGVIFKRVIRKIFGKTTPETISQRAQTTPPHPLLLDLLAECQITLLQNHSVKLAWGGGMINLVGICEKWAGRSVPDVAYAQYDASCPGLVIFHNPDLFDRLRHHAGDLFLAGHTHGGQINLPILAGKLAGLENRRYARGHHRRGRQHLFVNHGLGSHYPCRFFSPPEIVLFECQPKASI